MIEKVLSREKQKINLILNCIFPYVRLPCQCVTLGNILHLAHTSAAESSLQSGAEFYRRRSKRKSTKNPMKMNNPELLC